MPKLTLYGIDPSPPVRAVKLTLAALNLPYEYKIVNLLEREHLTKEYLAKNPSHTVPALDDDGQIITDSHAIITYLVNKYAKDDSLYPKDPLKRAMVDQRLYYETGAIFYNGLRAITKDLFFLNITDVPKSKIDNIIDVFKTLEVILQTQPYVAGDKMTVADFSIVSTVSSLVVFVPIEASSYPKLAQWLKRMEQLPYYEDANGSGAKQLIEMVKGKGYKIVA